MEAVSSQPEQWEELAADALLGMLDIYRTHLIASDKYTRVNLMLAEQSRAQEDNNGQEKVR